MRRNYNNNTDVSSIHSVSSQHSVTHLYVGKERKAQIRLSFKIFQEMAEQEEANQQCKLAMKFPQIRIILAFDRLLTLLANYQFKMNVKGQLAFINAISPQHPPLAHQQDSFKHQQLSVHKLANKLYVLFFKRQLDAFTRIHTTQPNDLPQPAFPKLNFIDAFENLMHFAKLRKSHFFDRAKNLIRKGNALRRIGVISSKNHQISMLVAFKKFADIKQILIPSFIEPDNNVNHDLQELNTNSLFSLKERVAIKFAATTMITNFLSQRIQQKMFQFFFSYQQMLCWHQQNLCVQQQQYIENLESQFQGENQENEENPQQDQDVQNQDQEISEQFAQEQQAFHQSFQNPESEENEQQDQQESMIEKDVERELSFEQKDLDEFQNQQLMEQVVKKKILATNQLLYTFTRIYQDYFDIIKQVQTFRQQTPQASGLLSPLLSPPSKSQMLMNNIKKIQYQNLSDQGSVTYVQSVDKKDQNKMVNVNQAYVTSEIELRPQHRESVKHLVQKAQQIKVIPQKEEENMVVKLVLTFVLFLLLGGLVGYNLV